MSKSHYVCSKHGSYYAGYGDSGYCPTCGGAGRFMGSVEGLPVSVENSPTKDMTLRQYYAGLAMQGMLAKHGCECFSKADLVEYAAEHADALIAELEKKS